MSVAFLRQSNKLLRRLTPKSPFNYQLAQMIGEPTACKKALVFLAPGTEEMEFVISVDVLRRAGIEVTVVGLPDQNPILCSRGVVICPDVGVANACERGPFDAMVLPGGLGGAKALAESQYVGKLLKDQEGRGGIVAAICAAPTALKAHNIGVGRKLTSYPSVKETLTEGGCYHYLEDKVVTDGNIITSRGPGTAYEFALEIVKELTTREKAAEVAKAMLVPY